MSQPQRAGEIIADLMRGLREQGQLAPIAKALGEVLPSEQAALCHIAGCRGGRVWIEVDSAPLCAELRGFRRDEIRLALNQRLQRMQIAELVFRIAGTGHV